MRCKRCGARMLSDPRGLPFVRHMRLGRLLVHRRPREGTSNLRPSRYERSAGQGVQRGQQEAAGAPTARASVS